MRVGVSPVLFYDPVERVVATLHPNHTWEKVVFDPWRQETWDVNDTVLIADPKTDPDVGDFFVGLPDADYLPTWHAQRQSGGARAATSRTAAAKAAVHAATPHVAHADTLGRDVPDRRPQPVQVQRHGTDRRRRVYATRVMLDIEGNQREVIDANDRVVMRYDYDMLGTRIHQASMEAGERWMLNDVAGKPIHAWDSRDHEFRTTYDALRRPTRRPTCAKGRGSPSCSSAQTSTARASPTPEARQPARQGRTSSSTRPASSPPTAYDFKGNLLREQPPARRRTTRRRSTGRPNPCRSSRHVFASTHAYDALNRPTSIVDAGRQRLSSDVTTRPTCSSSDARLQAAAARRPSTPFVTNIDYDAKGQRALIEYGNGVTHRVCLRSR